MEQLNESQLFIDLTLNDQESFRGGGVPALLVAALNAGGVGLVAAAGAAWYWIRQDGNGFIYGDRKGSSNDLRRAGKNMPDDAPNGWNWAIRDSGEWVAGGYNGQKP